MLPSLSRMHRYILVVCRFTPQLSVLSVVKSHHDLLCEGSTESERPSTHAAYKTRSTFTEAIMNRTLVSVLAFGAGEIASEWGMAIRR